MKLFNSLEEILTQLRMHQTQYEKKNNVKIHDVSIVEKNESTAILRVKKDTGITYPIALRLSRFLDKWIFLVAEDQQLIFLQKWIPKFQISEYVTRINNDDR